MEEKRTQMIAPDGKPRFIDPLKVSEYQDKGWKICPRYMSEAYYPQFDQSLNPIRENEPDSRRDAFFGDLDQVDAARLGIMVV